MPRHLACRGRGRRRQQQSERIDAEQQHDGADDQQRRQAHAAPPADRNLNATPPPGNPKPPRWPRRSSTFSLCRSFRRSACRILELSGVLRDRIARSGAIVRCSLIRHKGLAAIPVRPPMRRHNRRPLPAEVPPASRSSQAPAVAQSRIVVPRVQTAWNCSGRHANSFGKVTMPVCDTCPCVAHGLPRRIDGTGRQCYDPHPARTRLPQTLKPSARTERDDQTYCHVRLLSLFPIRPLQRSKVRQAYKCRRDPRLGGESGASGPASPPPGEAGALLPSAGNAILKPAKAR